MSFMSATDYAFTSMARLQLQSVIGLHCIWIHLGISALVVLIGIIDVVFI